MNVESMETKIIKEKHDLSIAIISPWHVKQLA